MYSSSNQGKSVMSENLPPRTLARVSREVREMMRNPAEGTKLVIDPDTGLPPSLHEIMAEIEGPTGTPYANLYFQLKLVMPSDFPNSPPRGYFLTKIYHPNVDMSSGAICVNTLKKDWTPTTTISHVLGVIRCLLIIPFPESSLNDEAGKLFMESYEEYAKRAKVMANVHGRAAPCGDAISPDSSPIKHSKENQVERNHQVKSSSSGAVLKQSNSVDRNGNEGVAKKAKSSKSSKNVGDKKSKKKSLKRL